MTKQMWEKVDDFFSVWAFACGAAKYLQSLFCFKDLWFALQHLLCTALAKQIFVNSIYFCRVSFSQLVQIFLVHARRCKAAQELVLSHAPLRLRPFSLPTSGHGFGLNLGELKRDATQLSSLIEGSRIPHPMNLDPSRSSLFHIPRRRCFPATASGNSRSCEAWPRWPRCEAMIPSHGQPRWVQQKYDASG